MGIRPRSQGLYDSEEATGLDPGRLEDACALAIAEVATDAGIVNELSGALGHESSRSQDQGRIPIEGKPQSAATGARRMRVRLVDPLGHR